MKRLKVCGKRAISSMLAAAMLITVFPFSAAAEEGEDKKDITIQWEQVTQEPSDKAAVTLSASLDADSEVQSATVNIKLSAEEAGALTTTFSEDSAVKLLSPEDQLALLNDGITPITEEEADDDEPEEPAVVEEETDDNKAEESDTTNGQDETDVDETDESGDDVVQDEAGADDPEGSDDDVVQDETGADDPEEPVSETTLISLDQSKTAQMADSEQYWLLTFTLSQPEEETTDPTIADEGTDPAAPAASGEGTESAVPADTAAVQEGEASDPRKVTANLTFTLPEGARENLKIEITADDISITAKDADGEDVTSASFDIQPLELTLEAEPVPTISAPTESVTIPASGAIPDLSYTLSLDGVEDIDYWLQLTLPEGLALPAGTPTAEETANGTNIVMSAARTAEDGQTDQPEDNILVTVTGLPEGMEINDISVSENTEGQSTLTFHLEQQAQEETSNEESESLLSAIATALFRSADTVTITINGDKLQRSTANEIEGAATLALYDVDPSEEAATLLGSSTISITAAQLETNGTINIDGTTNFTRSVIWVDGAEAGGRLDEDEFEQALYDAGSFTLTELNNEGNPIENGATDYDISTDTLYRWFGKP